MAGEDLNKAAERLRAAGLRVTAPRMAVLAVLQASPGHWDVETIRYKAQQITGSLSTQAAYDVLKALTEAGLTRCLQVSGQPARYENRVGDNHHHFVCRVCGKIVDVNCAVGVRPCLEATIGPEYEVDEAEVTFWGRCPECR
ncbi:Fur family transcriptional regulator [Carbonactinospora thermoautotrophica]|uniref:Ferric uptake regulator n=1 Tax=Carbonactinospora thermoautotrophica TaxID=1469144 RepID=A0A132MYD8_9ACTN|nr:Fur family transcriptional regulator [Carbonactinospora thermoautotrophica]KWX02908.1 Ferric uptake regulator [Carbonactinospora thermoautotrophica]